MRPETAALSDRDAGTSTMDFHCRADTGKETQSRDNKVTINIKPALPPLSPVI